MNAEATSEFFSVVQNEGGRNVSRKVKCFNLDVIIAVGYRVKQDKEYISEFDREVEKYLKG